MQRSTIQHLNQITTECYLQAGPEFDRTRQTAWEGWDQVQAALTALKATQPLNLLDVGCGNGRWAKFIAPSLAPGSTYDGLDMDEFLLDQAHANIKATDLTCQLKRLDVIEVLLASQDIAAKLPHAQYDVITVFGFIHHVPSQKLRKIFLRQLAHLLKPNGLLIMAAWQPINSPKLMAKQVDPISCGVQAGEMEPNDYILTWEGEQTGYRYTHVVTPSEMTELIRDLPLEQVSHFTADGHTHNLNLYWIWRKTY